MPADPPGATVAGGKGTPKSLAQEVALLRAELHKLQVHNSLLGQQLQLADKRLPGLGRLLKDLVAQQQELASGSACGDAAAAARCGPSVGVVDLMLSEAEVEEAAMRAVWLARYWNLACRLDTCSPCIAAERAAYWQQVAPPFEVLYENAQRMAGAILATAQGQAQPSSPAIMIAGGAVTPRSQLHATVADAVELERAMRQLEELEVVHEVVKAVSCTGREQTGPEAWVLPSSNELARLEDPSLPLAPQCSMSSLEAEEIGFQKAWLAYMWGQAAMASIEPQISRPEAERWAQRLGLAPLRRDWEDLRASFEELRLHSIEQLMWRRRYK